MVVKGMYTLYSILQICRSHKRPVQFGLGSSGQIVARCCAERSSKLTLRYLSYAALFKMESTTVECILDTSKELIHSLAPLCA